MYAGPATIRAWQVGAQVLMRGLVTTVSLSPRESTGAQRLMATGVSPSVTKQGLLLLLQASICRTSSRRRCVAQRGAPCGDPHCSELELVIAAAAGCHLCAMRGRVPLAMRMRG